MLYFVFPFRRLVSFSRTQPIFSPNAYIGSVKSFVDRSVQMHYLQNTSLSILFWVFFDRFRFNGWSLWTLTVTHLGSLHGCLKRLATRIAPSRANFPLSLALSIADRGSRPLLIKHRWYIRSVVSGSSKVGKEVMFSLLFSIADDEVPSFIFCLIHVHILFYQNMLFLISVNLLIPML